MRFLGFAYVVLQSSLYNDGRIGQALHTAHQLPKGAMEPAADKPTKRDESVVGQMRAVTRNQLEIVVLMYGNPENKMKQRAIRTVGAPAAAWHGRQSKDCRSVDKDLEWGLEQMAGGYYGHLGEMVENLVDSDKLRFVGMRTEFRGLKLSEYSLDHPEVVLNQEPTV